MDANGQEAGPTVVTGEESIDYRKAIEVLLPFASDHRVEKMRQVLSQRSGHARFVIEDPSVRGPLSPSPWLQRKAHSQCDWTL